MHSLTVTPPVLVVVVGYHAFLPKQKNRPLNEVGFAIGSTKPKRPVTGYASSLPRLNTCQPHFPIQDGRGQLHYLHSTSKYWENNACYNTIGRISIGFEGFWGNNEPPRGETQPNQDNRVQPLSLPVSFANSSIVLAWMLSIL